MKAKTGTREWSDHSYNIQLGCEHNCRYCYARANAIRWRLITVENWPRPRFTRQIPKPRKYPGVVMFPTTHDITPNNVNLVIDHARHLLAAGNRLLFVSKPHYECIKELCTELRAWQNQVEFRFTIGTLSHAVAMFWDPGAPGITERIEAAVLALRRHYRVSISAEPFLASSPGGVSIDNLVDWWIRGHPTGDIWVGMMNRIEQRVDMRGIEKHPYVLALKDAYREENIRRLYEKYKNEPRVMWKDSIRRTLRLDREDA